MKIEIRNRLSHRIKFEEEIKQLKELSEKLFNENNEKKINRMMIIIE
jgi:hypothetical protein